jgi:NADH dehydrogenase (ubiquinone) 1 alpha subcomplex subunit 10
MLFNWQNRIQKHSKIIVVDGPVASGKVKFAKELAQELDFLFVPQPTFDKLYVTHWGFDVRTVDDKLPEEARSWDIERFLHNPHNRNTTWMQFHMFYLRYNTYTEALTHLFATGQGVVTIRCPWTDQAFSTAMYKNNYISKEAFSSMKSTYVSPQLKLLKPHLLIYLDTPVKTTLVSLKIL